MSVRRRWAGIALVGATALAGPVFAQVTARAAPAIRREIAVPVAPVNPVPDAGETDGTAAGPEAREAQGLPILARGMETAAAMSGSLNAQYAALQGAGAVQAPMANQAALIVPAVAMVAPELRRRSRDSGATARTCGSHRSRLARRVVESAARRSPTTCSGPPLCGPTIPTPRAWRAPSSSGGTYQFRPDRGRRHRLCRPRRAAGSGVRRAPSTELARTGQGGLAEQLAANPRLIMARRRAPPTAAARAAKALGRIGSALLVSGAAVKQSAYDIQHSAWSKASVAGPEALLAEVKARSAQREAMGEDARPDAMLATLTALRLRSEGGDGGSGRLTPVVAKGLTLAALAVLGEAGRGARGPRRGPADRRRQRPVPEDGAS